MPDHTRLQQYKHKFKAWGWQKNLSVKEMDFVAKVRKRRLMDGKETKFYHRGALVSPKKIYRFERRRQDCLSIGLSGVTREGTLHKDANYGSRFSPEL